MLRNRAVWAAALLLAGVAVGYGLLGAGSPPAHAQGAAAGHAGGRYQVIDTEATNIIVVDNANNTLYYYTTEKDGHPGDDLHLRGTLDLNDVGKPVLKPKKVAK